MIKMLDHDDTSQYLGPTLSMTKTPTMPIQNHIHISCTTHDRNSHQKQPNTSANTCSILTHINQQKQNN